MNVDKSTIVDHLNLPFIKPTLFLSSSVQNGRSVDADLIGVDYPVFSLYKAVYTLKINFTYT